jgi:hypothetical protein
MDFPSSDYILWPAPGDMVTRFDGACLLDSASPDTASGTCNTMTVTASGAADINHAIFPDEGTTDKWLLLHQQCQMGAAKAYLALTLNVHWEVKRDDPAHDPPWDDVKMRCTVQVAGVSQNFDWANIGAVAPPRNTWNNAPTIGGWESDEISNTIDRLHAAVATGILDIDGAGSAGEKSIGLVVSAGGGFGVAVRVLEWRRITGSVEPQAECSLTVTVEPTSSIAVPA